MRKAISSSKDVVLILFLYILFLSIFTHFVGDEDLKTIKRHDIPVIFSAGYILAHILVAIIINIITIDYKSKYIIQKSINLLSTTFSFFAINLILLFYIGLEIDINSYPAIIIFLNSYIGETNSYINFVLFINAMLLLGNFFLLDRSARIGAEGRPLNKGHHFYPYIAHTLFAIQLFFMFPNEVKIIDLLDNNILLLIAQFPLTLIIALVTILVFTFSGSFQMGFDWFIRLPKKILTVTPPDDDPSDRTLLSLIISFLVNAFLLIFTGRQRLWKVFMGGLVIVLLLGTLIYLYPLQDEACSEDCPECDTEPCSTNTDCGSCEPPPPPPPPPPLPANNVSQLERIQFMDGQAFWVLESSTHVEIDNGEPIALLDWDGSIRHEYCALDGIISFGLASSSGGDTYNLDLSRLRARATRAFLEDQWQRYCGSNMPEMHLMIARGRFLENLDDKLQRPVLAIGWHDQDASDRFSYEAFERVFAESNISPADYSECELIMDDTPDEPSQRIGDLACLALQNRP